MKFQRVEYSQLSGKQKEIHNFQKLAGLLADYGFNCIKLDDDWQGADFLAYHKDGHDTLKVQLKSRLTIAAKYRGKGLHVAFPLANGWCVIEHDELVRLVGIHTGWLASASWVEGEEYSSAAPAQKLVGALAGHIVGQPPTLAYLFDEVPEQWGLRGDPYLWSDMRAWFAATALPCDTDTLVGQVGTAFKALTGHDLHESAPFHVEKYAHGGMSSGVISPEFWQGRALPLLSARLKRLNR